MYRFRGQKSNGEWVIGSAVKFSNPSSFGAIHLNNDTADFHNVVPDTIGISINLKDKDGIEVFENDVRIYKGKEYLLVFDGFRSRLERNMVKHGENEDIVIDEDVIYESTLIEPKM
jgi:hypothetical protein